MKTLVVVVTLILGRSRYQLFLLPVSLSSTCSFLDTPFFTAKVFLEGDITNFYQLYNWGISLIFISYTIERFNPWGV